MRCKFSKNIKFDLKLYYLDDACFLLVIFKYVKYYFNNITNISVNFTELFEAQVVSDTAENNLFTINEQTKISFSIPNENFLFSNIISDSIDIDQLEEIYFKPFSNSSKFEAYKFYIKKIKIKNQSAVNKTISVMPGLNHIKSISSNIKII